MGRRWIRMSGLGAGALAIAAAAWPASAQPPSTPPRGSLLRWLLQDQPTPQETDQSPVGRATVDTTPQIKPEATSPASTTDRRGVRSIEFRRSDGVVVRSVVYDDLRRDDAAPIPPPIVESPPPASQTLSVFGTPPQPSPTPPESTPAPTGLANDDLPPLPTIPTTPPEAAAPLEMPELSPVPDAAPPLTPVPVESAPLEIAPPVVATADPALPSGFTPWWGSLVVTPLRDSQGSLPVAVDTMVCQALSHSPQVAALQTEPVIRRTQIVQEEARFDWTTFLESRYDDISDPVGNTLTTGGPDRLKNQKWTASGGIRRQNTTGGEFEAAQKFGWEDSNSRFFLPSPQRTARLQLAYTQPLLYGSGRAYNESRIVLAQINTNAALDEVRDELQSHLLKVATTYWDLYRARAVYLQRLRCLDGAEQIMETLEARQEVDAQRQQILRAKAAVSSRRTTLVRAGAEIRDAESRLKMLVNHPALLDADEWEIIPSELPRTDYIALDKTDSLNVAMMFRPDIARATKEIRSAGVRLGVAENELLPKLDLILSSYLYGLDGENLPEAFAGQYDAGRPSFAAGLQFEMPLGNRAALARQDQREWELSRAMHQYRAAVQSGLTDVELALREVETAHLEMQARSDAMSAALQESEYLKERWLWLGGSDRAAAALLEELLLAQERLVDEEVAFVTAQVRYVVSLSEARRAMGTLMQCVPENQDFPEMATKSAAATWPVEIAAPPEPPTAAEGAPASPGHDGPFLPLSPSSLTPSP